MGHMIGTNVFLSSDMIPSHLKDRMFAPETSFPACIFSRIVHVLCEIYTRLFKKLPIATNAYTDLSAVLRLEILSV